MSANISANAVKDLREKTGAGMMDCKKALTESGGDFDKAIEFLRKRGMANAAKKAGRATRDGVVSCVVVGDGKLGAVYEINCETDFVARTEQFREFVKQVGEQITATKPASAEALLAQSYIKDGSKTIDTLLKELIAKLGENMAVRRVEMLETSSDGFVGSYIHGEGKVGILVEFGYSNPGLATDERFKQLSKNVAMQVAAMSPQYVSSAEIPAEVMAKEREIAVAQLVNAGKPADIAAKAAEGKVRKFYEEVCLLNQIFFKDQDMTIQKLVDATAKELNAKISVKRFVRFQLGEGMADTPAE